MNAVSNLQEYNSTAQNVDGSVLKLYGKISIPIVVAGYAKVVEFKILDRLQVDIILGMGAARNTVIDLEQNIWSIGSGIEIPLVEISSENQNLNLVSQLQPPTVTQTLLYINEYAENTLYQWNKLKHDNNNEVDINKIFEELEADVQQRI
eukprot:snap_masked-scaffold_26-processed-gene-4.108-mRNA-1 protein AED:1.00 eAED:1.00 QI:0/0/0/0/1/1/2/0/149